MFPFRTNPRRKAVRQLRAAQAEGRACLLCGARKKRPTRPVYANGISGWSCPRCPKPLELTR